MESFDSIEFKRPNSLPLKKQTASSVCSGSIGPRAESNSSYRPGFTFGGLQAQNETSKHWTVGSRSPPASGNVCEIQRSYQRSAFKWKIGDQEEMQGVLTRLEHKNSLFSPQEEEYQISMNNDDPLVYYSLKKIKITPRVEGPFQEEQERLKSFRAPHCPTRLANSATLFAKAGFYYPGYSDVCKCFVCGVEVHQWLLRDNVLQEHRKWSPECQFMKKNFPGIL